MLIECPGARRGPPRALGVVSDLDGTLLRSDGSLSPTTMSVLDTLTDLGVPLVVATARTPRALQKVSGHDYLGRVVYANGAIVWDAKRDEVVTETCFDPPAIAVAVHRLQEVLPGAGVALLSARRTFLDETYLGLRNQRAEGAEGFSDIDLVLSRHRTVMVAVRHPRLLADHLLTPTAAAIAGVGLASFAAMSVVDIVPRRRRRLCGRRGDVIQRLRGGSDRRVRRHPQRPAAVRLGWLGLRCGQQPPRRS